MATRYHSLRITDVKVVLVALEITVRLLFVSNIGRGSANCSPPCLVYATTKNVIAFSLEKSKNVQVIGSASVAISVDVDFTSKLVYWCDLGKTRILRAFLDGSGLETVIQNAGKCEGLAVEWVSRNLYWTNAYHKRIGVSHLDGTDRSVLITTGLDKPRAVVVDPLSRFIFWSDWGSSAKIEKATLSGEYRKVMVSNDLLYPNGLVIDYSTPRRLYWTDVSGHNIGAINLDGSDKQTIVMKKSNNFIHPFDITIYISDLYFTNWWTGSIHVVDKRNGTHKQTIGTSETGTIKTIMGIATLDKSRQPKATNDCSVRNGGCSNLCLPRPKGLRCSCPDGLHLNADEKTCSKFKDFLLFSDQNLSTIYLVPIDTRTQITQTIISPSKHHIRKPVAVEYDATEDRIYWSDTGLGTISRAYLSGHGFQVLHRVTTSKGLSIDRAARKLLWTSERGIEVSGLDGAARKVLVSRSSEVNLPVDIRADSTNRLIYWVEWGRSPSIRRAKHDGSAEEVLIDKDIQRPYGLAIDSANSIVYWTDLSLRHIESYNPISKKRRILHKDQIGWSRLHRYMIEPFGIAVHGDSIYWTEWTSHSVYVAKIESGAEPQRLVAALGKPMDVITSSGQIISDLSPRITCPDNYDIYNKNIHLQKKSPVSQPTLSKGSPSRNTTSINCVPEKISPADYGDHTVTCTATSQNGDTDTCSYQVWVKDHHCKRLPTPVNGNLKCKIRCIVTCKEGFLLAYSTTKEMACYGQRWKPFRKEERTAFPVCLPKKSPSEIELYSNITFKRDCHQLNKEEIEDEFRTRLKDVLSNDDKIRELLVLIDIKEVALDCSETGLIDKLSKMKFALLLNLSRNHINSERIMNPERTLHQLKSIFFQRVNERRFNVIVNRVQIKAKRDSYQGTETAICKKNEAVRDGYYCVTCSFGMFFNETSQDCELCGFGYYQDKEGQTNCIKCPPRTSTVVMGTDTGLGCYGGQELITTFHVKNRVTNLDWIKQTMASLINQYCENYNCLETNSRSHPEERLSVDPGDVVIPDYYPKQLENGNFEIGLFVVISFTNQRPDFLAREKVSLIILPNLWKFEPPMTTIRTEQEPHHSSSRGNSNVKIIAPSVVVPVGMLILIPLLGHVIR